MRPLPCPASPRLTARRAWPGRSRAGGRLGYRLGSRRQKLNRARFYQPGIGRFSQEDPIRGTTSLYAYVHNRPEVLTDPTGMKCCVKRMTVQLFPATVKAPGAAGATIRTWICGEVENPQDCVIQQRARTVGSYDPVNGFAGDSGWGPDSPNGQNVFRLPGKICMYDSPGWPMQEWTTESNGRTTTSYFGAPGFPFYDSAVFETTVRDRHDRSDSMTAQWGYVMSCQSPGQCTFVTTGGQ